MSIETDEAEDIEVGPVFPAASVTEFAARLATTVPSEPHTTVTVTDVPDDADGVKEHPVAVPVFENAPDTIPDTDSEKASV